MATSFIVSYDLRGRDETSADYAALISAIEAYRHGKLQLSTWLVISDGLAEEIRDDLLRHLDDNDRLLVAPLDKPAAWHNLILDDEVMKARP
jgi:hypothetical protein